MLDNSDVAFKNVTDHRLGEHLAAARISDGPIFHQKEPVSEVQRLIQVVQGAEDADLPLPGQFFRLVNDQLLIDLEAIFNKLITMNVTKIVDDI